MSDNLSIGAFIKAKRKSKGYTLEYIGKHVGVSKATVSRWETGDIENMRTDKVQALCNCLGITTKEFLERSTTDKEQLEQLTPKELLFEVKKLANNTPALTEQERTLIIQTLDVIISNKK